MNRNVIESVGMNIAIMNDPLIQSALNQNAEAKLWGVPGERSQCDAAMRRSQEASFRGPMGLRLGRVKGRASPHWAKSGVSASIRRLPAPAYAVSGRQIDQVIHAITQDTWLGHVTGEVPRCLPPQAGVNNGYKQHVKGQRHAPVAGTVSYRPRLQGCQQSQSSPVSLVGQDERQNRKQSVQASVTRIVSQAIEATKWPAGTFSRTLAVMLRNILTGAVPAKDGPSTTC